MTGIVPTRVVVVTGSTRGIGRAVVLEAAGTGHHVVINGRDADQVRELVATIEAAGGRASGVVGDVTRSSTVTALTDGVVAELGRLDVLVNNAGGGRPPDRDTDLSSFDGVLNLNLRSVHALCQAALPHLRAAPHGRIVNVTSVAGRSHSRLSGVDYAAAKAGVHGLTRHLAHTEAARGVTVNAVAPGLIATERAVGKLAAMDDRARSRVHASTPMGRAGRPEEVAAAILFLASPRASFITGATIDVNGGAFLA